MSLTRWNLLSATCRYAFCGGALYWTSTKGFWGGFCESQNLYCETSKYTKTQLRQVEWKYGIKLLRDEEQIKRDIRYNAKNYWNLSVQKTFYFLSNMKTILSEQYDNFMSGNFMKKTEEEELEAADYEDAEEEEIIETKPIEKESTEAKEADMKKDIVDATGDAKSVAPAQQPDAKAATQAAAPVPQTDKEKLAAAAGQKLEQEGLSDKEKELEAKIRSDPSGKKGKLIEKIKKIHGM